MECCFYPWELLLLPFIHHQVYHERKDPIIFSRQAEVGNYRVNRQSMAAAFRVPITA